MPKCCVCGHAQSSFIFKLITLDKLAKAWRLSARERLGFDHRESDYCRRCGCSRRSRAIAKAIMKQYPQSKAKIFIDWTSWADTVGLRIAEINYCGDLHPFLQRVRGNYLSQYYEHTWRARIANLLKGIKREDITHLSYPSDSFDLVLHTEVLEHLPDTAAALRECRRVLKPNGVCLFTVPLLMDRRTLSRQGKKASYHGSGESDNLVYWEFGKDFIKKYHLGISYSESSFYLWVLKLQK